MARFNILVQLLVVASVASAAYGWQHRPCVDPINDLAKLNNLQIRDAKNQSTTIQKQLPLEAGGFVTLNAIFTPRQQIESANLGVAVGIDGEMNVLIDGARVCDSHGFSCPIQNGKQQTFSFKIPIPDDIAKDSTLFQAQLVNEVGLPIFCTEIDAFIV